MFKKAFWQAAAERAVKSAAQGVAGLFVLGAGTPLQVDWKLVGLTAAGAAFLSVVTSLASLVSGKPGSPSAVDAA